MKVKPSIFISRPITKHSPLNDLARYYIEGKSLIAFQPIDFQCAVKDYTWIFFYSSIGAKYFLEGITISQLTKVKIACLGPKTAQTFTKLSQKKVDFIGDGKPETTSAFFKKRITKTDKILFARALHSRQSVQKVLDGYNCHSVVVYTNTLSFAADILSSDIVVLTSPMNAERYFKSGLDLNKPTFIAIGETTGDCIYSYLGHRPLIPESPSEESIAQLILSL